MPSPPPHTHFRTHTYLQQIEQASALSAAMKAAENYTAGALNLNDALSEDATEGPNAAAVVREGRVKRSTSYSLRTLRRRSSVSKAVSLGLEVLDLTNTGLGPKGGMAVAQLLQCTEKLRELHLVRYSLYVHGGDTWDHASSTYSR
jgi:hypothetical protein